MNNFARKIINEFSNEEKEQINSWARDAYIIRNDVKKTKKEKIFLLGKITNKNKVVTRFLYVFFKILKRHSWDDRGWAGRLALGGFALGATVTGSKMAGLATAGFGIGIPIWLLTSAGGALLGTIIEESSKK